MDYLLPIATILLLLYTLVAGIYIILENRSPQSTFAWLLLFVLLPIIGIIIYHFCGRGWHAFSKEKELTRQELGGELLRDFGPLLDRVEGYVARIANDRLESYRRKLLRLSQHNDSSILTGHNEVTILQDAREKYPRLLADIRAARHHVHLNYYIWTEDSFTIEVKDALIERARAGVAVRCLYDASGGALSAGYLRDLREGASRSTPTWNTARSPSSTASTIAATARSR